MKGVGGQRNAPAALSPGKETVPVVQKAGCDTGQDKSIKLIDIIYRIPYNVIFRIIIYIIHCRLELHMRSHFTNY